MVEKKQEKELLKHIGFEMEDISFILEPAQVEVGSGYTVSVNYDENEKQVIDVKIYGEVNVVKMKRQIRKAFPNATIRNINDSGSVSIIKPFRKHKESPHK
jgi:hypothetical protein